MQETIAFMNDLADESGKVIRQYFRKSFKTETKTHHDPVTEADKATEQALRAMIADRYPNDGIQGEEFGITPGASGRVWVIDPIDGTKAFAVGRATFSTLIALCIDGQPVIGCIDQPIANERWIGAAGMTTFNGHLCHTRGCDGEPAFVTTTPDMFTTEREKMVLAKMAGQSRFVTYGGDSYAYGLLSSGLCDLVCEAHLKAHDLMAVVPIIQGAGGVITDWSGRVPSLDFCNGESLACGDAALHARLLALI
jgi:histidinol phosphatase-like enzyme (inositol monophosphatase family)